MAILTTNELHETYEYSDDVAKSRIVRRFIVRNAGNVLNAPDGPAFAIAWGDIPSIGSELGASWGGRTLQCVSRTARRHGPEECIVEVVYEFSPEVTREIAPNVPFDEQLDISSQQVKTPVDLDLKTIGEKGEGATVYLPVVKWSFKCNTRPSPSFYQTVGKFNDATFPNIVVSSDRPFIFAAKTLLFLGANGQHTRSNDIGAQDWVWNFTFNFAYREISKTFPDGWEYEYSSPTFYMPLKKTYNAPQAYFMHPETGVETAYSEERKAKAEVSLYRKDGFYVTPYNKNRVRESANFTTAFPFAW